MTVHVECDWVTADFTIFDCRERAHGSINHCRKNRSAVRANDSTLYFEIHNLIYHKHSRGTKKIRGKKSKQNLGFSRTSIRHFFCLSTETTIESEVIVLFGISSRRDCWNNGDSYFWFEWQINVGTSFIKINWRYDSVILEMKHTVITRTSRITFRIPLARSQ
jgi:hypothetical protein